MTPDDARARYTELYGEVTDEEWDELSADVEDWDKFFIEKAATAGEPEPDTKAGDTAAEDVGASLSDLKSQVANLTETVQGLVAKLPKMTDVVASLEQRFEPVLKDTAKRRALDEVKATIVDVDGIPHRYAQSANEVLAALFSDPGIETANALMAHLKVNGGKMCLMPLTEVTATMDAPPPGSGEAELADLMKSDPVAVAAIRRIAADESLPIGKAKSAYFGRING